MRAAAVEIQTERLLLDPLVPAHADELAPLLDDASLHAFSGGRPRSLPELRALYERQARGQSADGSQLWLNWIIRLRDDGRALGFVQATVDASSTTADVAWVIASRHWRRGYAREAAAAMAAWLRANGVTALTAHVHPDHAASAAVARAIGLAPTATVVDGEMRWEG